MSAAAVVGTSSNNDQSVIQNAAHSKQKRDKRAVAQDPKTSVPVLLVVAGALGALLLWRRRGKSSGKGSTGDSSSSKSRFAFPASKGDAKAGTPGPSKLPRNKQITNNKKNMVRRKEEKQRRADKRERAAAQQASNESRSDPDDPNNHLVYNYSYYDNARRDYLHAPAQAQKKI